LRGTTLAAAVTAAPVFAALALAGSTAGY